MKNLSVLLMLVVALTSKSIADVYPIDPRPLRRLVMESEYIVTGIVKEIKQIERKEKKVTHTDTYAIISVTEVLQGKISEHEISVEFNPYYICPAPARYVANDTVVAFLSINNGAYHTVALSYGAKSVSEDGRKAYCERIREIQQINSMADGLEKFEATVEWLVKCTEHPETRWEGTYELSPNSDFMSYYSRTDIPPFSSMLSQDQKARLEKALLKEKESGYVDFGLVDLVYPGNEKEVNGLLLSALKNLSESRFFYALEFMERLKLSTNDPALDELTEQLESILWERNKEQEQKKIIQTFVTLVEKSR